MIVDLKDQLQTASWLTEEQKEEENINDLLAKSRYLRKISRDVKGFFENVFCKADQQTSKTEWLQIGNKGGASQGTISESEWTGSENTSQNSHRIQINAPSSDNTGTNNSTPSR